MEHSEREQLINVFGMSLYDIVNQLCGQMMDNNLDEDYIGFKAVNGIDKETYELKVTLKKVKGDD